MSEAKLTYGLYPSTKRLIHIKDAENGLACGCVCPECGDKLEAVNNGKKRTPHFRHSNGADCPRARMTALHMLAQKVFEEHKRICLPSYYISPDRTETPGVKQFECVSLEQTKELGDKSLRPDCIAKNNNNELWVEFRVTHEVDTEKSDCIKKNGIYCVEVDLRSLLNTDYTESSILWFLVNENCNRIWINCPNWDKLKREAVEKQKREEEELKNRKITEAKDKVKNWLMTGDKEGAAFLEKKVELGDVKHDPINYREELLQGGDIWDYIDHSPKTPYALNVFYQLLIHTNVEFHKVDRQTLRERLESSMKAKDYFLFAKLLMVYIIYVSMDNPINIIVDGDEYVRFLRLDIDKLLGDWHKRKEVIAMIQASSSDDLDQRIEYAIYNNISSLYTNLSENKRKKEKKMEKVIEHDGRMTAYSLEREFFYNPYNVEAITHRCKNWSKDELAQKIADYEKLLLSSSDDERSKAESILSLLKKRQN